MPSSLPAVSSKDSVHKPEIKKKMPSQSCGCVAMLAGMVSDNLIEKGADGRNDFAGGQADRADAEVHQLIGGLAVHPDRCQRCLCGRPALREQRAAQA